MEKQTNFKDKQRVHRLIQQGGLIDMAGLSAVDKPLIAGLLLDCKRRLDLMTDQQRYDLRKEGYLTMQERKGKRYLERAKKQIKPFKFWDNPEVQAWQKSL
jgi:hypothetical protein